MSRNIRNLVFIFALLFPISVFAAKPTVLIIFDDSGSMWGQIEGKTKIELTKTAMTGLLKEFPENIDIGLIVYGHRSKGNCSDIQLLEPVGSGRETIISAVSSITPKGKTPLTRSIESGSHTRLGRQFDPYKEFFYGQLDDIRIYAGVLTIDEISAIAEKSRSLE